MNYQSLNPFDGRLSKSFPVHTTAEIDTALSRAEHCFHA